MKVTAINAVNSLRLAPVGASIYCGATDGRLTEEHIIPKGLGGTLVLPQASCDDCAAITSLFEMR
ncbi:HNH endonuclease, partial [Stenotrophomonas sp. GbtcB23]|uniref:HNH endonuclease n=1 Tax=Stenotrophomonas sp. GbtcB23 TaxID=2824768 RepID=UPI001C2F971C